MYAVHESSLNDILLSSITVMLCFKSLFELSCHLWLALLYGVNFERRQDSSIIERNNKFESRAMKLDGCRAGKCRSVL